MHGYVYPPPASGLPYLAVVFKIDEDDGELMVVTAVSVLSQEEGHAMISNIIKSIQGVTGDN